MKFTTLIPMRYNDGKEVPVDLLDTLIDELAEQFQGCSEEGVTKGQWLDLKVDRLYRDESRRVTVVCDNEQLWDAREAVIRIGQKLGQLAMYFEVRDYDGVQFLQIPLPKKRKRN